MLAYLISAYTDPDHLARLIAALDHEADFYVHVDANVDDAPFRRLLPKKVHFVPRHHVSWELQSSAQLHRDWTQGGRRSWKRYRQARL